MNAILKNAFQAAERLSPEDQKVLAKEIEKRADELWIEAELAKGEASGGEIPMDEVFDRIKRKYGSLRSFSGARLRQMSKTSQIT